MQRIRLGTTDLQVGYDMMVIARGRPMPWAQRPDLYIKER
jgi:hypothetical protein